MNVMKVFKVVLVASDPICIRCYLLILCWNYVTVFLLLWLRLITVINRSTTHDGEWFECEIKHVALGQPQVQIVDRTVIFIPYIGGVSHLILVLHLLVQSQVGNSL